MLTRPKHNKQPSIKLCAGCGLEREIHARSMCDPCYRKEMRKDPNYLQRERKKTNRSYYKHKEQRQEGSNLWKSENKGRVKKYNQGHYIDNREDILQQKKGYRNDPDFIERETERNHKYVPRRRQTRFLIGNRRSKQDAELRKKIQMALVSPPDEIPTKYCELCQGDIPLERLRGNTRFCSEKCRKRQEGRRYRRIRNVQRLKQEINQAK